MLPVIMVLVTTVLAVITHWQWYQPSNPFLRFEGTQRSARPPAHLLAVILNGPAMSSFVEIRRPALWFRDIDLECLPAVAVMWFLIGWAFERRLRRLPSLGPKWIRRLAFGFAGLTFLLMCLFFCSFVWISGRLVFRDYRQYGLWASGFDFFVFFLWNAAITIYFGRKFWATFGSNAPDRDGTNRSFRCLC